VQSKLPGDFDADAAEGEQSRRGTADERPELDVGGQDLLTQVLVSAGQAP
jgi:hypothetical protein